jgi:predicted ATP-grasp superfamily ATP-dependent carboligase
MNDLTKTRIMKANRAFSLKNLAFIVAVMFLSLSTALAQKSSASVQNSLTYAGTVDGHMNFLLNYDNELGEKFFVLIADANGKVFFEEVYAEKKFNRIFSIPVEAGNITLTITSFRNKNDKKFQVTTERKLIEEVTVSKPSVKP